MKAVSRRLVLAVWVLGCGQTASAQTVAARTADEIIEKYLTAIGGLAALGKVTSRSTIGSGSIVTAVPARFNPSPPADRKAVMTSRYVAVSSIVRPSESLTSLIRLPTRRAGS